VYPAGVPASIEIGSRRIGRGHRCFVIAEVGVNHNGNAALAHRLIDEAVEARADAVKFQTFTAERLVAVDAPKAEYQRVRDDAPTQAGMLARLALDEAAHVELKAHADAAGIEFLSSPFDEQAVSLLERLGVRAFKIASGEVTNPPLLRRVAATGKSVLLSTGMSTLADVDRAIDELGSARDRLALLHCVSSYPADPRDCNLRAIDLMRSRYGVPVGWSDHTVGTTVAIAAVAVGADLIEKHITLDRTMPGPDHAASIEPAEFRSLVSAIRTAEDALGEPEKRPSSSETSMAAVARRSLHWRRGLSPGESVAADDLIALRPGTGIPPTRADEVLGRTVRGATSPGSMVKAEELDSDGGRDP
jgi:N-acetylneuraminate synthase